MKGLAETLKQADQLSQEEIIEAEASLDMYRYWAERETTELEKIVTDRGRLSARDFGVSLLKNLAERFAVENQPEAALHLHAKIDGAFKDAPAAVARCLATLTASDFLTSLRQEKEPQPQPQTFVFESPAQLQ